MSAASVFDFTRELSLRKSPTGQAYLLVDDRHAPITDRVTWSMLRRAGICDDTESPAAIPAESVVEPFPSLDVTGAFYHETDGPAGLRYAQGGHIYDLDQVDSDTRAAFGTPVPAAALFPPGTKEILKRVPVEQVSNAKDNWVAIAKYLRTIPPATITEPPGLVISPGPEETAAGYVSTGNVQYAVTAQQQSVKNVLDSFPVVSPVTDTLWPGALVQGASLASGLVAPIQIAGRATGTLTITTELVTNNPQAPTSVTVAKPSLSTVTTARQSLLMNLQPVASTGRVSLEVATISTEQQVSARLGANVSGAGWNASARVDISGSLETSRTLLKLTQEFYTVAFEPTGSPAHFFDNSVTVGAVKRYAGPGNPPAYIQQVTYGRIFLFTIDSSDTALTVDSTVKGAWKAAVSGDMEAQAKYRSATKSYQVQIASVGVTGATAFRSAGNLIDALKALSDTSDFGPANPGSVISYSARYLVDGTVATAIVGPTKYRALVRADQPVTVSNYTIVDGRGGVQGGKSTGLVIRPGDAVSISALGHVWAGWIFGSWFGPEGDTSQHGRQLGNGTKPLTDAPYSALIYGFGQGWYYWQANPEFICGVTEQTDGGGKRVIGSATTPLVLYLHLNDDNVSNGQGGFNGQILIRRRPLAAIGPI